MHRVQYNNIAEKLCDLFQDFTNWWKLTVFQHHKDLYIKIFSFQLMSNSQEQKKWQNKKDILLVSPLFQSQFYRWSQKPSECENSFHLKVTHTQKCYLTVNSTVQFISLSLCPLITFEWNKDSINKVPFKTTLHLGEILYCTNTHKWKKLFIDADQVHDFFR